MDDIKAMAHKRQEKIARYKKQKETETQLKEMRKLINRDSVDDEVKVRHSLLWF